MATCPECRRWYPETAESCEADGTTLVPDATFTSVERDLSPGEIVGEYRIERRIGRGSFGVVYAAVHPVIGKAAAVKILTLQCSANPHTVSRFISEARAVNQIRHRNIVDIFSFGALPDGRQYYVMELLDGEPLDQYLAAHAPLPPAAALPILDRIARALDAAHGAGIVHRDLKPANVFLAVDADGVQYPKLLDFGIAKLTREEEQYTGYRTHTGAMLGTPYYMSPEQCRGETVDHRTDIYAFGVMVHEMLSGELPFDGESLLKIMTMQTTAPPPRVSKQNAALAPEFDAPVLHMLEKQPANRPRSAGEAFRELHAAARAAGKSVPPTSSPPPSCTAGGTLISESTRMFAVPKTASTLGAQSVSNPPPRRLVALTTALTTVAVALAGVALVVARYRAAAPPVSASATPNEEGVSSAAPERAAPSVTPSEPADDVRFSIKCTPPAAEAFLDGRSLGTAPGPFVFPRGDDAISVVFKAPGYLPKTVVIKPSGDGFLSVSLSPAPATPPANRPPHGKRAVDDLEF
jgi:serine/threonine protein kinase